MSNDQINAAIAEACGWTDIRPCTCGWKLRGTRPPGTSCGVHLPNYCADLNLMHEAERVCLFGNAKAEETYWLNLYDVCGTTRWPFDATARQRAEAFLRTLRKLQEAQP